MRISLFVLLIALIVGCGAATTSTTQTSLAGAANTTTSATTSTTTQETSTSPTTTTKASATTTLTLITEIDISVTGGSVDRVATYDVTQGDDIRLVVTADMSDEVHLHGYDLRADVAAGVEGVIEFTANIPGVFEVELEDTGLLIAELRVAP